MDLEVQDLAGVLYAHSYGIAQLGAAGVLDQYNPDRDGFSDDVMQPWLAKAATGTATQVNHGEMQALAGVLFVSAVGWRESFDAHYEATLATSPELWGQTVETASFNFGAADAAKATGLGYKTWRHIGGETSRATHAALDGEKVPADQTFSNGGRWPGDPALGADDNAQCHCRVEYSRD
jgi:hypothetical protein